MTNSTGYSKAAIIEADATVYRYEVRSIAPDKDMGHAGELIGCQDNEDEARQLAEDSANQHYYGTVICRVGNDVTDYDFGDGHGFVPWPESTFSPMVKPQVGDRKWAVDWTASIPKDEYGDSDLDNADERCERYASRELAIARAKAVLPLDAFGCVTVTAVEFVPYDEDLAANFPHAGYWEAASQSEVIDE